MSISEKLSFRSGLGLFSTTAIIMGTMIGSGIFKKTAPMAALLGSTELMLFVWLIAGIVTLFGALSLAEISAMLPVTGGQYKYYQLMYGDVFAFVSGWSIFAVIQSGSIAAIAYVFSDYFNSVFPLFHLDKEIVNGSAFSLPLLGQISLLENIGVKLLSCVVILFLTIVNYRGVQSGGNVSSVFTSLKVFAMIAIVFCCFAWGQGTVTHFTQSTIQTPSGSALVAALALALSKAFWAYDGWGSISYVGGEIRNAQKTIPKALIIGVSGVIALYMLINCAYVFVLPMNELASSNLVAADVMTRVLGSNGASIIAVVVMISTLGATNGTILNSARVYYAMAKDKLFFSSLATIHPRYNTPSTSLVVQCLWSCGLVLTGTFETLTDMLIFVSWIYYGLSAYGVFILRKKMPDTERPYKVWAYPFTPIVFIAVAFLFVSLTLIGDIQNYVSGAATTIPSLSGIVITLSGLPLYWYFNKKRTTQESVNRSVQ